MLFTKTICRTLASSSYTNSSNEIEKLYQGNSLNEIKNRNTSNKYVQVCYEMSEADKLHPSYDLPHKDRLIPDLVSAFGGCLIIKRECYRMVLLFVDV